MVPELWQFLLGLRPDDLVAELIQNELDAGSSHTVLAFGADSMTCSGNGEPVDEGGWQRLTFLKGAGDLAPKKRGRIGIKNHGLKACFAVGNDIAVLSAGLCARQTLFADGADRPPRPGAQDSPDATGVAVIERGTIIEVTYRKSPLKVTVGEEMVLPACTPQTIEELFLEAARSIQARFMGVVRPGTRTSYTIELRHHSLGSATFRFAAGRITEEDHVKTFLRTCEVTADRYIVAPGTSQERVVLGTCARPGSATRDVADIYRNGERLVVEVSWPEDLKGRPKAGPGRLRYPIAYAEGGFSSSSGVGASYSAPFVSDVERHGLASGGSEWNNGLIAACDLLLVSAIKAVAMRRGGARSMDLLVPANGVAGARLPALAAACLRARAVPLEQARRRRKVRRPARPDGRWSVCLAPCYSRQLGVLSKELALVAPGRHRILAFGTCPQVVTQLLAAGAGAAGPRCLAFSEADALGRLRPTAREKLFGWASPQERMAALSDPAFVRLHLDAVAKAIASGTGTRPDLAPAGAELPDVGGKLHPAAALKKGAAIPPALMGAGTPPILHPLLADHRIFKVGGWKLQTFRLDDLLRSLARSPLAPSVASALFCWLAAQPGTVPAKSWPTLRALPIWPSECPGERKPLSAFCQPPHREVARILSPVLHVPGRSIERLAAALRVRRLSLRIRTQPNKEEVRTWIRQILEGLHTGTALDPAALRRFQVFEADLATLTRDPTIASLSEDLRDLLPCLTMAGHLAPLHEVVGPAAGSLLGLLPEHVAHRDRRSLEALFPTAASPAPNTVRAALRADPRNESCLFPRLKAIVSRSDGSADLGVSDISCISMPGGGFECPSALAFKGNDGDYWGEWRKVISGAGRAQIDQALLKSAGVISAEPNHATSRQFFGWVTAEPARVVSHLPQIVRHFAHPRSVASWWAASPDIPCLPVKSRDGLRLFDRNQAIGSRSLCYLNDFPELATEILCTNGDIFIAVDRDDAVRRSIRDVLADIGVKSLRRAAGAARTVEGTRPTAAPPGVLDILERARSGTMTRQLQKRVADLGIRPDLLVPRWHRHLQEVTGVAQAGLVSATYLLGRTRFTVSVRQAFDSGSGTLWLADGGDDGALEDAFFEALADRMFVPGAPAFCAPALAKALRSEMGVTHRMFTEAAVADDGDESEDEAGEAPDAHHDWTPNPARNLPAPGPLSGRKEGCGAPVRKRASRTGGRVVVIDEAEQVAQLKRDHYAWHCQMGLARSTPAALAPASSYVEQYENRMQMIDAHHPDAVAAGGARHAGNILILSHLAHHQFGRRISRAQVTTALRGGGTPHSVQFGAAGKRAVVEGVVVEVQIPLLDETVTIFFSRWHRDYWLERAGR